MEPVGARDTAGEITGITCPECHGSIWLQTGEGFSREARWLDRAPSLVLGDGAELTAGAEPVTVLLPAGLIEVEARQLFAYAPGEGLVARSAAGAPQLLCEVEGQRRWAVQDVGGTSSSPLPPAAVAVTADGDRKLLAVFTTSETFSPLSPSL